MHTNNFLTCSPTSCEQNETLFLDHIMTIYRFPHYISWHAPHIMWYYALPIISFHMHVTDYHTLYFRPRSSLYIMLQTPPLYLLACSPHCFHYMMEVHRSIMYAR